MSSAPRSSRGGGAGALLLAALAFGGAACAQILGLSEWEPHASSSGTTTASGGRGGSGTSSTSSTGSASGGGGAGGTGAGGGTSGSTTSTDTLSTSTSSSTAPDPCTCKAPSDCGGCSNLGFCAVWDCVAGACTKTPVALGTQGPNQVPGDCMIEVCDGNGNLVGAVDNGDVPQGSACVNAWCNSGSPAFYYQPVGTTCNGSGKCNGWGQCQMCDFSQPTCSNGCVDADEGDTDCGSACSILCGIGQHCNSDADCGAGSCRSSGGVLACLL